MLSDGVGIGTFLREWSAANEFMTMATMIDRNGAVANLITQQIHRRGLAV